MPTCCVPGDLDRAFSAERATREAHQYRTHGASKETRAIADVVRAHGVNARTVLEIGGGIGALQIELLRSGAARAANVELSRGYEAAAGDLLREAGLAARVDRRIADFAAEATSINPADVVLLQRVICCYPDVRGLVSEAAAHTRELLVLTFPVERWWMRLARVGINFGSRLGRSKFRFFVHSAAVVIAEATAGGLTPLRRTHGAFWQMLVFERPQRAG